MLTPERDADALIRRLIRLRCVEVRTTPVEDGDLLRVRCDSQRAEAEERVRTVSEALPVLNRYTGKPKPWMRQSVPDNDTYPRAGAGEAVWRVVRETRELDARLRAGQTEDAQLRTRAATLTPWLDCDLPLCGGGTGTLRGVARFPAGENADIRRSRCAPDAGCRRGGCEGGRGRTVHRGSLSPAGGGRRQPGAVGDRLPAGGFFRRTVCRRPGRTSPDRAGRAPVDPGTTPGDSRRGGAGYRTPQGAGGICAGRGNPVRQREHNPDRRAPKAKLASTGQCAVLEGWVPAARDGRVSAALDKLFCAYEMSDPEGEDQPPVLLKNNGYATTFEWVVGMYSYPKYGTYDPTFVMSLFYFVIFGLMFADVGYGAILLSGGFPVPRLLHMEGGAKRMFNMFGWCGISCVIMGAVFGGWFGDLPYSVMANMMGYGSIEAAKEAAPWFNGLSVALGGKRISLNPLEEPMAFPGRFADYGRRPPAGRYGDQVLPALP